MRRQTSSPHAPNTSPVLPSKKKTLTLQPDDVAIALPVALTIAHTLADTIITDRDSQETCPSYTSGRILLTASKEHSLHSPMTPHPKVPHPSGFGPGRMVPSRECHGPQSALNISRPGIVGRLTADGSPPRLPNGTSHMTTTWVKTLSSCSPGTHQKLGA